MEHNVCSGSGGGGPEIHHRSVCDRTLLVVGMSCATDSHPLLVLQVHHYVEKPETFVSTTINCGIYLFTPDIFHYIGEAFRKNHESLRYKLYVPLPLHT